MAGETANTAGPGGPPGGLQRGALIDACASLQDLHAAPGRGDRWRRGCLAQTGDVDCGAGPGEARQLTNQGADQRGVAGLLVTGEGHGRQHDENRRGEHQLEKRERSS